MGGQRGDLEEHGSDTAGHGGTQRDITGDIGDTIFQGGDAGEGDTISIPPKGGKSHVPDPKNRVPDVPCDVPGYPRMSPGHLC